MNGDIDARVLIIDDDSIRILLVIEREKLITLPNGESFMKPSKWGMPGGRGEPGDKDAADAAWRETKEETNISVLINEDLRVEREKVGYKRVVFVGYLDGKQTIRINSDEILDCKWFTEGVVYDEKFNMYSDQRQMAKELLERLGR